MSEELKHSFSMGYGGGEGPQERVDVEGGKLVPTLSSYAYERSLKANDKKSEQRRKRRLKRQRKYQAAYRERNRAKRVDPIDEVIALTQVGNA